MNPPIPTSSPDRRIKSKERVSAYGEVFTADREVNAMLDLVKQETERIDSRFLEPACGNGNFLARILERKLAIVRQHYAASRPDYELYALIAAASLYGIEILEDNVAECRTRLFTLFRKAYLDLFPQAAPQSEYLESIAYVFHRNILWGDALNLRTPDGREAITFSEWTAVNGSGLVKRRDFELDMLLKNQPMTGPNLFSDLGDEAFIPTPKAEYPLIHYLKIHTYADHDPL